MKIQFCANSLSNNIVYPQNYINNLSKNAIQRQNFNDNNMDIFTKSSNGISFQGVEKNSKTKDVLTDLAAIGIVGSAFALSIGASSYAMNRMNPKDIFLPDGTYFTSIDELKTPVITADAEEGILKIKDTPIDIDASRYDIADIEHGVFKNMDGSVDIDLMNNKYIDIARGVIIDPENNISCIRDLSGNMQNIVLPDLSSPNFGGASLSDSGFIHSNLTREEYINIHHIKPEDSNNLKEIYTGAKRIPQYASDRVVDPDDNRTIAQKLVDFFNPLSSDGRFNNLYDKTKEYDIFGREILTITKSDGSVSKVAIDENLKAILDKYHLKADSLGEIADFFEKIKLKEYLLEYSPAQDLDIGLHVDSLQEFLHRISESHSDVAEAISNDAITETLGDSDVHTTFIDIIRGIFENLNS